MVLKLISILIFGIIVLQWIQSYSRNRPRVQREKSFEAKSDEHNIIIYCINRITNGLKLGIQLSAECFWGFCLSNHKANVDISQWKFTNRG